MTSPVMNRVRKLTAETVKSLKAELLNIEAEKKRITCDLDETANHIRQTLAHLGQNGNWEVSKKPASPKPRKGKRTRRTPEQLKQEADAIIAMIKAKGAEGASGPEIRERHARIGPDLKGFIQHYSGKKLKTTGVARSMRYFVN